MSKVIVRSVAGLLREGFDRQTLIQGFVEVNQAAWPPPVPERYLWTEEKVCSQFEHCPHLLFVAFAGDRIIGTLSIIHISQEHAEGAKDWEQTSGFGTLSTHEPDGNCAFGLDLSVRPDAAGEKAGDALIEKGILCAVILENRKGVFLGSRVPSYRKWALKRTIEEHVFGNGRTRDPEIRLYQSEGFRIIKIVPGYMEDPDSLNYGVLMFWENRLYRFTRWLPRALTSRIARLLERWL